MASVTSSLFSCDPAGQLKSNTNNDNTGVIPVLTGTNQTLSGHQNGILIAGGGAGDDIVIAGTTTANLGVTYALNTQFNSLAISTSNATLEHKGSSLRFGSTTYNSGGTINLNASTASAMAQDLALGQLNDSGQVTVINKNGANAIILDQTANPNTASNTTFNINGGGMVLVGTPGGNDPAGGAVINLNPGANTNVGNAQLILSGKAAGTSNFGSKINLGGDASIVSYQVGSAVAGATTALTHPGGIDGPANATLTLGVDNGNTLRIQGPIDVGNVTVSSLQGTGGRNGGPPTGTITLDASGNTSNIGGNINITYGTININSPIQLGANSIVFVNHNATTASPTQNAPSNITSIRVNNLGAPTINANAAVIGGLLYLHTGTYNANAVGALAYNRIVNDPNVPNGGSTINYNIGGAGGTPMLINPPAFGGTAGVLLQINSNIASLDGDTLTLGGNSILSILSGGSPSVRAALFDRTTNLTAAINAIIAGPNPATILAVQNLGTAADLKAGLNGTWGGSSTAEAITLGTGTPFNGIAPDRSDRRYGSGVITVNSAITINSFGGYNGNGTNQVLFNTSGFGGRLQIGNASSNGGRVDIVAGANGKQEVSLVGYTFFQNGITAQPAGNTLNLADFSGVSKFILTSGSILQTDQTNAFGGAGGTEKPTLEVLASAMLDPGAGNDTAGLQAGSINTDALFRTDSTLLLNDNFNLNSPVGVITMEPGAIIRLAGNQPFGIQSPGSVPGVIVRLEGSSHNNIDANLDDGIVLVMRGGDRTINNNLTLNGSITGTNFSQISGVLTNDDQNRRFSATSAAASNGVNLNIGTSGATFAAASFIGGQTNPTTFTIGNAASNVARLNVQAGTNKITVGVPNNIVVDGLTRNGIVVWTGQNAGGPVAQWRSGSVDIVSGTLRHDGGGADFVVGGGTGLTTIFAGADFRIQTGVAIDTTAVINAGGTLRMHGSSNGNASIGGIGGAGNVILGGGATNVGSRTDTVGGNGQSTTLSGVISTNFGTNKTHIIKAGAGTWTLEGVNTYSGSMTVNAGTVEISGTGRANGGGGNILVNNLGKFLVDNLLGPSIGSSSRVIINSGGTLGGIGQIGSANNDNVVTVASGGTLSPGISPGILGVSSSTGTPGTGTNATVVLASGANFNVELDPLGLSDKLVVGGTIELNGANLVASLLNAPSGTESFTIVQNDAEDPVGGTFSGLPEGAVVSLNFGGNPYDFNISYQSNTDGGTVGNDVTLSVVPEPAAVGLLGIAAAAALGRRRRRK